MVLKERQEPFATMLVWPPHCKLNVKSFTGILCMHWLPDNPQYVFFSLWFLFIVMLLLPDVPSVRHFP